MRTGPRRREEQYGRKRPCRSEQLTAKQAREVTTTKDSSPSTSLSRYASGGSGAEARAFSLALKRGRANRSRADQARWCR
jgi:hypothetical protein